MVIRCTNIVYARTIDVLAFSLDGPFHRSQICRAYRTMRRAGMDSRQSRSCIVAVLNAGNGGEIVEWPRAVR